MAMSTTPPAAASSASTFDVWSVLVCVGTGFAGVVSGFAIFFLILQEDDPWFFLAVLGVATGVSFVIEYLRDLIVTPTAQLREDHHHFWSSALVSLVIVGLSEVFALAWHAVLDMLNKHSFWPAMEVVRGGALSAQRSTSFELVMLAGLWIVSGMILAGALGFGIERPEGPMGQRMKRNAVRAGAVGALFAPVILLVVILAGQALRGLYLVCFAPEIWRANFQTVQAAVDNIHAALAVPLQIILLGADKLLSVFGEHNRFGPLLVLGAMFGTAAITMRKDSGWFPITLLLTAIGLVMAPMLPAIGGVGILLVRTAVVWALPGVVLGGLVPLLEWPAARARWWSVVAFAAAIVLIVLTLARLEGRWWLLVPAAGIVATGGFVWRTGRVDACWPMLAVSVATVICGSLMILQQFASFSGVLDTLYDLDSLPDRISAAAPAHAPTGWESPELKAFLNSISSSGVSGQSRSDAWSRLVSGLSATDFDRAKAQADAEAALKTLSTLGGDRESLKKTVDHHVQVLADLRAGMTAAFAPKAPFHARVEYVATTPATLNQLGQDARTSLDDIRQVIKPIRAVQQPYDTLGIRALVAQSGTSTLPEPDASKVRVWKASQDLLDALTPYESRLVALVGESNDSNPPSEIAAFKKEFDVRAAATYGDVCRDLELGLAGSFGFWATLGLLAGWALYRRDTPEVPAAG